MRKKTKRRNGFVWWSISQNWVLKPCWPIQRTVGIKWNHSWVFSFFLEQFCARKNYISRYIILILVFSRENFVSQLDICLSENRTTGEYNRCLSLLKATLVLIKWEGYRFTGLWNSGIQQKCYNVSVEGPPGWTTRGTVGLFLPHCTSPGARLELQKGLLCALLLFVNLN